MIPLLERRLRTMRVYEIPPDGMHVDLKNAYERQQRLSPCDERIRPLYRPRRKEMVYSDMAVRGPGTQEKLAERWGLTLPADYLEFCSWYSEYILAGRIPIRILESEEVIDSSDGVRDGWDIPRTKPHRLLYFASVIGETADFAFRWSEDLSRTDIVFSWDFGDIGEPILLGKDGDRFVSDQTFTGWLRRMLETDGHPLFPGGTFPTSSGWTEQNRSPLIQIA